MSELSDQATDLSRRRFLKNTAAGVAAASAVGFGGVKAFATESSPGSTRAIPELAPQWKKLDLAEILARPAAFVSISQNKSLYETGRQAKNILRGFLVGQANLREGTYAGESQIKLPFQVNDR